MFLFSIILVATIVRPILVEQSVFFTYLGIFSSVLSGAIYLFLINSEPKSWHPYLIAVAGIVILIPLLLLSGGVNSQYASILPLLPVLICLVGRPQTAWLFTLIISVLVFSLYLSNDLLPNYTVEQVSDTKTASRAVWLIFAAILGATFGAHFVEISQKLRNKLQEQTMTDDLTGVSNRRSILEFLADAKDNVVDNKTWLTVLLVDIDNLKNINEEYGQGAGDYCLKSTAECLHQSIRNRKDAVGRYGGEEFLIVLEDVDQGNALRISEKIRSNIEALQCQFNQDRFSFTVTIGYCSLPSDQLHSIEQMIVLADTALFAGKNSGRNKVVGAEQSLTTETLVSHLNLET